MPYSFRQIRDAILSAGAREAGFPYGNGFAPERLEAIRSAPHLQSYLAEIRDIALRAGGEPVSDLTFDAFRRFSTSGTRREYERPYFARRCRLAGLTLAATIDADDAYLPALHETIWAICNEYSWCVPAHIGRLSGDLSAGRLPPEQAVDLFAAETAHALAETLTMMGDRLDPWLRYRIRYEIERRVFRPLFHDPVHFWWESTPMNWAAVCAGACGMAAMLLETDLERLAGMVDRCVRAMECFLEGFGSDGGCAEGVGYWQYGFGYYVYFTEMLYELTEGAIDLLAGERIRKIASFPAAVSLGDGNFVNYSDGSAHLALRPGILSRLARRIAPALPAINQIPSFHADACYRWPHATRDIIWADPALLGQATPTGTVVLDGLGWVVDRRDAAGTLMAFSARAGHNAEPHNQNDLGHFIIHVGGESLLTDLGAGLYTRQYFGPQRYEHIHNSSEGHSVPFIDGQAQLPGEQHAARVLRCEPRENGVLFEVELAGAYGIVALRELRRTFDWSYDPAAAIARLRLDDRFDFSSAPGALEELFISLREPAVEAGVATWRGARGTVWLRFDEERLEPQVEAIDSQDHDGTPITVYRLRLRVRAPQADERLGFSFECRAS